MQETGEYQRCIYVQQQEQEQEQEDEGEGEPTGTAVVVGGGDDNGGAGIDPGASGYCIIIISRFKLTVAGLSLHSMSLYNR